MKKIVCFGEVLWDMLPTGKKLGGAPLNVALRAQSLDNQVTVISSIGKDSAGEEIINAIQSYSTDVEHIQTSDNFPTSEVLVHLDQKGSATYEIKMPCAWDDIRLRDRDIATVQASDAFIFGSLISRSNTSRNTLLKLIENSKYNIFDVNLRPPHYSLDILLDLMKRADFIKFNSEELHEICSAMGTTDCKLEECVKFIADQTNTNQICVTRGKNGAVLFIENKFLYNSGYFVTVADTVGSGDSFLATIISKLLNGAPPKEAIDWACAIGAIVASKSGANPEISKIEIETMMKKL